MSLGAMVPIGSPEKLVNDAIARCPDYFGEQYDSVHEMFGEHLNLSEMKVIIDELFVVARNVTLSCLTATGQWRFNRHPWNMRGDMSSKASRKASIEEVGICQDVREPPWFIRDEVDNEIVKLLHQATLLADGAKAAWEADLAKDHENRSRVVCIAVFTPIKRCTEYHKRTPKPVVTFLVDYANRLNTVTTATTFVQVWRSTKEVKAAFKKKKIR
jgi:hypothetical protein